MQNHLQKSIEILKNLQHPSGLFSAASSQKTGYHRAWIRDTVYEALALERHDLPAAFKAYHALLDVLKKHEFKIDWAIKEKPSAAYQYIHARYDPEALAEIREEWGNKQNDAIGALLFRIGELEKKGVKVLRDLNDYRLVQKLIFYLGRVEYWQDQDNGMWEEYEEVHASSVGACVAGLKAVKDLLYVPEEYIVKGEETLARLLPRESETKEVDLALLSLIYPYNIVSPEMREHLLKNVEEKLVREKGVIRYVGDQYYNDGAEAEWTFGFSWLSIIYKQLGNMEKYKYYLQKTIEVMNEQGELPELYLATSKVANENTPLGWSQGMFLLALEEN